LRWRQQAGRLGWMVLIWAASVIVMAAVAWLIKLSLGAG
jgi:hypothetical protein